MGKTTNQKKNDGIIDGKELQRYHDFGLAKGRIFSIDGRKAKCTMVTMIGAKKERKEIGFVFQEDGKYRDTYPLSLLEVISDPTYKIKSMKLSKSTGNNQAQ